MVGTTAHIQLRGTTLTYTLRRSARARALRLLVYPGGLCIVTAPLFVSEHVIGQYLFKHATWILEKIARLRDISPQHMRGNRKDLLKHKATAYALAQQRLAYFNQHYGVPYKRITIRNQKTRWGSCSKAGNLSFNYKIALLPHHLADYIIVHELCHLAHFNHGRAFWALVAETIPDFAQRRAQLTSGRYAPVVYS